MFPTFLSATAQQLQEQTSIQLAQQIQQTPIDTPLAPNPIQTTYVHQSLAEVDSTLPPVLLLHGFDSSVLEFRRLIPQLAPQVDTWAIDLLGFGFTDRLPELQFTAAAIKTHLHCTWKTLINQPVVLVGASMGGAAAIDFAATHPEAVAQLVLLDSAGLAAAGPPINRWLTPLAYAAAEFLRNPWVRDRISRTAYFDPSYASADAACCAALHLACPGWRRAMVSFTQSGGYGTIRDRLDDLRCPTLVLWGQQDKILGTQDAQTFQQLLPQSPPPQLYWIDRCGHVPHLEQSQATAAKILEFIQSF